MSELSPPPPPPDDDEIFDETLSAFPQDFGELIPEDELDDDLDVVNDVLSMGAGPKALPSFHSNALEEAALSPAGSVLFSGGIKKSDTQQSLGANTPMKREGTLEYIAPASPRSNNNNASFATKFIEPAAAPTQYVHPTTGVQLSYHEFLLVNVLAYRHRQDARYPVRQGVGVDAPLLFTPDEVFDTSPDATAMVYAFLESKGFTKTAEVLRRESKDRSKPLESRKDVANLSDFLPNVVSARLTKDSQMFNDSQPWNTYTFMKTSFPLVQAPKKSMGGGLDLLIEKLVLEHTEEIPFAHPLEPTFTNIFLLTQTYFTTPHEFFTKLTKMFKTLPNVVTVLKESRVIACMERVATLVLAWTDVAVIDFPKSLLERILTFAVHVVQKYSGYGMNKYEALVKTGKVLLIRVQDVLGMSISGALEGVPRSFFPTTYKNEAFPQIPMRQDYIAPPPPHPEKIYVTHVSALTDIPPEEFARQLCLVDQDLFGAVRVREFYSVAWSDPTLRVLATNLNKFNLFNSNLSTWVSGMIIAPTTEEGRRNIFRRAVLIASHLYDMQNYSSAQAFLNGLDGCSVTRMVSTVKDLSPEIMEKLTVMREAFHPFRSVQRTLPMVLNTPCIPSMSPFLGDMTRVEEYAESVFEGNIINWSKMEQIGKVVLRLVSYQTLKYDFVPLKVVRDYIESMPGLMDPNALYDLSRVREPGNRGGVSIATSGVGSMNQSITSPMNAL
eukprot:PhF_6_TR1014/c0_g1_i3/m.2030/K03099/SOS; son of sevenless